MMAKFGLILLVLVFGVLTFLVGLTAPDSVRRPWIALTEHRQLPRIASQRSSPTNPASPITAAATPADPPSIPYQALLIPSPLPLDGVYALQVGSYPTTESAAEWVKRAGDNGWGASQISVLDQNGERWFAVAVGQFSSPVEARAARVTLARALGLAQPLPVIRLPPKPVGPGGTEPVAPATAGVTAGSPAAEQTPTPASP